MKLAELRLSISLDLTEPLQFGPNSKLIGSFDGHEIYGSRDFQDVEVYAVVNPDMTCRAALLLKEQPDIIDGQEFYRIEKIHVEESERRKGLGSSLIEFCVLKLGIKLRSGATVSKLGIALLSHLVKTKSIKFAAYDRVTQEVIPVPTDLFTDLTTDVQLLIVGSFLENKGMFESKYPILREFFYIDGTFD